MSDAFVSSVLLIGFGLFIAGAALIYHPLGFLVAGAGLMVSAFKAAANKRGK